MQVELTKGRVALVDAADFELVSSRAWHVHINKDGKEYARNTVHEGPRTRGVLLHRFLTGWPLVDHINGDGLDNRRANLRPATPSQNQFNRGLQSNNTSGYKGVYFDRQHSNWRARVRAHGRTHFVGIFPTAIEAALAYDRVAAELHGSFARLNFPEGVTA